MTHAEFAVQRDLRLCRVHLHRDDRPVGVVHERRRHGVIYVTRLLGEIAQHVEVDVAVHREQRVDGQRGGERGQEVGVIWNR